MMNIELLKEIINSNISDDEVKGGFSKEDLLNKIKVAFDACNEVALDEDTFLTAVGGMLNLYYGTESYRKYGEITDIELSETVRDEALTKYILGIVHFINGVLKGSDSKFAKGEPYSQSMKIGSPYLLELLEELRKQRDGITYTNLYYYILKICGFNGDTMNISIYDKVELCNIKRSLSDEFFNYVLGSPDSLGSKLGYLYPKMQFDKNIQNHKSVFQFQGNSQSPDFSSRGVLAIRTPDYENWGIQIDGFIPDFELPKLLDESVELNMRLEAEKKEKISLINDFSHKYGKRKESFLKDIAEYLLNIDNQDVRYYGRLALYEVSRKYNMDKDVEILKDTYSDNYEFLKKIRKSTNYCKNDSNLQYIIDETIKSCIITLLYDRTLRGSKLRYKVFKKEHSEDIDDILYDYEEAVIVNGGSALEWLKTQQIIDIKFNISGFWNDLCFYESEYSAVVLSDILSELIFNAIKYAEQSKAIEISFCSDTDFLVITETNSIDNSIVSDSGKGIESCNTLLKRFHKPLNLEFEPITVNIKENIFKEKIQLSKKLFVEE